MAAALTCLLLFTGVAVDSGRAYVVKAQLTKAVDGAALAAARNLNSGNPRDEAAKIYRANFPVGYMGTTSSTDPAEAGFFTSVVDEATGINIVTVTATAILPTTFMKLGNFDTVTVSSSGEATRRMVDLSLVLDVSSSIGPAWAAVRDAARTFISAFDGAHDRLALLTFSNGARVIDAMPSARGFDKPRDRFMTCPDVLPGGSTNMVEGLYRAWDEVRSVPLGSQSGLRIIVLFTDGASNSVPGFYDSLVIAKAMRTYDFPQNPGDTNGQTWNNPQITGFYDTDTGATRAPTSGSTSYFPGTMLDSADGVACGRPVAPCDERPHASSKRRASRRRFPCKTNALMVDGVPQDVARGCGI